MEGRQIYISKFEAIQPLIKHAIKEHVIIADFDNSIWFSAIKNNKVVGCVCCQFNGDKCRFKSDFVLPEYRSNGIYKALFKQRSVQVEHLVKEISAYCTPMSIRLYLQNGFKIISDKILKDKTKIYYVKK